MLVKSKVKYIQSLGQKKFRDREKRFIAEGPKLVYDLLLEKKTSVSEVFALPEWMEANQMAFADVDLHEISAIDLEKISQLKTPNQVLAVINQFENSENISARNKITLVLDNLRDPGNLGTIIRIADWFGVSQIICSHNTTELYNPKVVQATMGSIARVEVHYLDIEKWLAKQKDVPQFAAMLEGDDVSQMKKLKEGIIIIGNESSGVDTSNLPAAIKKITIPQYGKAESLNAAVATGIILSHLV